MERLTSNKKVSDMSMFELAHNSCYCKDGVARYRDFENDIDARDLARELVWSLADIELSRNNECFDEEIIENLQYDITKEPIGLIALFYRNLWAMADLRERLKEYEDAEEQDLLLRLPCKDVFESSGDTVYYIFDYEIVECINCGVSIDCEGKVWVALACDEHIFPYRRPMPEIDLDPTDWCNNTTEVSVDEWGKTVFLTKEEAEQKLKEMESVLYDD